jgi:hypothetical protein
MAERNFDEEYAYDQLEGHTFVLGGRKFHTHPVSTPQAYLALREGMGLDGAIGFLKKMIVDEDLQEFNDLIAEDNASVMVSAHQIDAVAAWLIEVAVGRPTTAPASSKAGRKTTSAR